MRTHAVMLLSESDEEAVVGCVRADPEIIGTLSRFHGKPVRVKSVELRDIAEVLGLPETAVQPRHEALPAAPAVESVHSLDTLTSSAPLGDLANAILSHAAGAGASDVCIETGPEQTRVRHRIDGVMQDDQTLRPELGRALTAKVKSMAGMDSLNYSTPQEGRMSIREAGLTSDVRVSAIPIRGGESLSLRFLVEGEQTASVDALGFSERVSRELRALHELPGGLVLACGPADSGKTTTLHAVLANAAAAGRHVMTVEAPVEYVLKGAAQISPQEIGTTHLEVLRAVLRQNPDVLLVGELRDRDTAALALRAALTGHLVFATLHSASPRQAIHRLRDLGAGTESLREALRVVLAQRLLRRRCRQRSCTGPTGPLPACTHCGGVGYTGRVPVGEVALCNGSLDRARASGGEELHREAWQLVHRGVTDSGEVIRVLGAPRDG
jgi:general secretion pathway protein E